ncbi:hypothetical protein PInf_003240 [Phytophthora infestans]|nr:hypothetical protein PInf_003240 [Phytophthora infestans]
MTVEGESRCLDPRVDQTKTEDEQVCYREGGDLHAEDLGEGMAVNPEVPLTTEEVTIDDIQVDPGANEPTEVDRLRQKIWESRHLLIGKGNALPPAARGVKCDIDVGDAKPIAQRKLGSGASSHKKIKCGPYNKYTQLGNKAIGSHGAEAPGSVEIREEEDEGRATETTREVEKIF